MKHKQRLLYSSFKLGLQSFHCILAWEWLQRVMSCVVTAHTLIPALRRQGRQISASEASLVQPSLPRLHSETLSPNNNKVQRKEVRLSGGVLSSMPDTRDLIPSNRYTHTAGHLWSNSQWHPPIQLNTQDSIPSDTCTPSQDVRDSIPTDTHTNTPSFCILNTWNNTNHDSRENVAAYICYFFSIFLGALSPRTMPPNLWGEIIPTLDLSSKHTIVSAQREQDILDTQDLQSDLPHLLGKSWRIRCSANTCNEKREERHPDTRRGRGRLQKQNDCRRQRQQQKHLPAMWGNLKEFNKCSCGFESKLRKQRKSRGY